MLTKRIVIYAPRFLEQGSDGTLCVTTVSKKNWPARQIRAWLHITADGAPLMRLFTFGAEPGSSFEIEVDTSRSGLALFEIKRIWIVSIIGLFSLPAAMRCAAGTLVMPAPQRPPNAGSLPRSEVPRPKPGGGFAENHELRPYRPGDPVRSIHWKVSAKLNSLVIREPMIPPLHFRLVEVKPWFDSRQRNLILGRLRWVADYLTERELPFYVKLGDAMPVREIKRQDDLIDYLFEALCEAEYFKLSGAARKRSGVQAQHKQEQAALPRRFTWVLLVDAREVTL